MRLATHYLENVSGIEIYPIISLLLFFAVFITMLFYVSKIPKKNLEEISNLPLEGEENNNDYE